MGLKSQWTQSLDLLFVGGPDTLSKIPAIDARLRQVFERNQPNRHRTEMVLNY